MKENFLKRKKFYRNYKISLSISWLFVLNIKYTFNFYPLSIELYGLLSSIVLPSVIACNLQYDRKFVSFNVHWESLAHGTCASIRHFRSKHVTVAPYRSHTQHLCRELLQTAASSPSICAPTIYTPSDQTMQSSWAHTS